MSVRTRPGVLISEVPPCGSPSDIVAGQSTLHNLYVKLCYCHPRPARALICDSLVATGRPFVHSKIMIHTFRRSKGRVKAARKKFLADLAREAAPAEFGVRCACPRAGTGSESRPCGQARGCRRPAAPLAASPRARHAAGVHHLVARRAAGPPGRRMGRARRVAGCRMSSLAALPAPSSLAALPAPSSLAAPPAPSSLAAPPDGGARVALRAGGPRARPRCHHPPVADGCRKMRVSYWHIVRESHRHLCYARCAVRRGRPRRCRGRATARWARQGRAPAARPRAGGTAAGRTAAGQNRGRAERGRANRCGRGRPWSA